jgi:hypothetical protein
VIVYFGCYIPILKITEVANFWSHFCQRKSFAIILAKKWVAFHFWVIFLQIHLVTLIVDAVCRKQEMNSRWKGHRALAANVLELDDGEYAKN